jgi:addiction module RelB/DinJ family antitoxin
MNVKSIKKTKVIQTRLDAELVDQASEILDYVGLSTTDLVRIVLKKVVNTGGVPASFISTKTYFSQDQQNLIDESLKDIQEGRTYSFKTKKEMEDFLNELK